MKQKQNIVARGCLALGACLVVLSGGSIAGSAMAAERVTAPAPCPPEQLSQLFLPYADTGWYTLLPGERSHTFDGARWRFDGGARPTIARLSDGRSARVLDLPAGASAVSPPVCVSPDFTTARAMARIATANPAVSVFVSIAGTHRYIGQVTTSAPDWAASEVLPLEPAITGAEQRVQFTLVAGSGAGDTQLYDFALDPRMK